MRFHDRAGQRETQPEPVMLGGRKGRNRLLSQVDIKSRPIVANANSTFPGTSPSASIVTRPSSRPACDRASTALRTKFTMTCSICRASTMTVGGYARASYRAQRRVVQVRDGKTTSLVDQLIHGQRARLAAPQTNELPEPTDDLGCPVHLFDGTACSLARSGGIRRLFFDSTFREPRVVCNRG